MKRYLLSLLFGCTALPYVCLADSFIVSDIRVDGLQRVSEGTVFNALPLTIGDEVNAQAITEATRGLFKTGYFQDIRLARDGNILVITVVERPSISSIDIEGNKAIDTEKLLDGLKQEGLAPGEIYEQATLEAIRLQLERQYVAQGRYGAKIESEITPLPRNRVGVKINIKEGKVATIEHINVVGNNIYPNDELLELFQLQPTGLLSFYTDDNKYSREKLSGDLERLRSYYLDRGYINFNITSTQVSISPDKEEVYITVNIHEGEKYTIKDVKLAGDIKVPESEMRKLIVVKEGDTFSRKAITKTEEFLARRLGNDGYTFANVNTIPQPHDEDNSVSVTFFVDPGKRVYVRRVNFIGNTKTEDEVLRREMRQMEGAWASTHKIEQSKTRLDRLGYFKEVNVETTPVAGTTDQIDVNYAVEEQASGSVSASVGFSQGSGLILGGNISQRNFLGTGNRVNLGLNTSKSRTLYRFGFYDPYYTVDGVSRGFDVFYRTTDYEEKDISNYSTDVWGGSMTFGYPLSETSNLSFGFGLDQTEVKTGTNTAKQIQNFIDEEGDKYLNYKFNIGWNESTLNRGVLATRGHSQSLGLELALPGSDLQFYKVNYRGQLFKPLTDSLTLHLKTNLGYGDSIGSTSEMPFIEHYYAGGFGSVRGFKDNTLGPRAIRKDNTDDDPIGGNVLVEGTAEVIFPLPFIRDQRSIRSAVFLDAGNVFDTSCRSDENNCSNVDLGELRYSAGFGVTWITGLGPLTFSLAKALNADSDDETEVFQFALGQTF
ncbi:outer membrane protein assembly factor BamA [Zooshikella harenae]|uniref:Outer membrane protein assembly factor BamA n=1 Tax=Zooshikella harenae TaxID=2827238 RepID=A0ABS5Z8W7_9GAMM|nr:outer membrane protein assembly factor BamA [Zooshikella harenae]MBU2709755.1 outer membrane protein assembly factor BamA [Zooshikella harenae]